ncbi:MAG: squalene--hopene cyclase [Acidobacteria bacterium]|nr:squalene--hopene cyclase [Acidobacteriota bacterium]
MSAAQPAIRRSALQTAIRRAGQALAGSQAQAGYWWADLTADSTLESDYLLMLLWLHPPRNGVWSPPEPGKVARAVASILARQNEDGGFSIYPQGPSEISASVKAYFALKLAGIPVTDPRLERLRDRILALGGIQATNSYVKLNLGLFGLYPREHTPTVPPEIMLLGRLIYEVSSWTRAIVIPLAIVHSLNPRRPVPAGFTLDELWKPGVSPAPRWNPKLVSWRNFFLCADRLLKWWERHGSRPLRSHAIRKAEAWMLERTQHSDGLGAIYPPMQYIIFAMDALGYAPDNPHRVEAVRQFLRLMVDDERGLFFQPCFSVVWDTAIAAFALGEAGVATEEQLARCGTWLLSKEVRRPGDWMVKRPRLEPSGWYFEFANEFYPDIDDTAMVLLGLRHARAHDQPAQLAAEKRAVAWLLGMQSGDGGWAAFDADNNHQFLSHVPFADHNAMLDPTCPDITGRVIEALAASGVPKSHPAIRRGVEYLLRTQQPDGSWFGRWGVNYVYGTFLALRGLRAAGYDDREAEVLRAGEWLRSIQNADGGWGESCASYDEGCYVQAPSTASQTAWAVLGLLAGGDTTSQSVHRGQAYLTATQRQDGQWDEDLATGTGFPRVFYLTYHMYRNAFPLLALAEYSRLAAANEEGL